MSTPMSPARLQHLLMLLQSSVDMVDPATLGKWNDCSVEKISWQAVPYFTYGASADDQCAVLEVTLWWGDDSVTENGQKATLTLWRNCTLTLPVFVRDNPVWRQVAEYVQSMVLDQVVGQYE